MLYCGLRNCEIVNCFYWVSILLGFGCYLQTGSLHFPVALKKHMSVIVCICATMDGNMPMATIWSGVLNHINKLTNFEP